MTKHPEQDDGGEDAADLQRLREFVEGLDHLCGDAERRRAIGSYVANMAKRPRTAALRRVLMRWYKDRAALNGLRQVRLDFRPVAALAQQRCVACGGDQLDVCPYPAHSSGGL